MAVFRGYRSDLTDKVIPAPEHVRIRFTAKGPDNVLHEGQMDILVSELMDVLPTLASGEKLQLKVGQRRGRKPGSKASSS